MSNVRHTFDFPAFTRPGEIVVNPVALMINNKNGLKCENGKETSS